MTWYPSIDLADVREGDVVRGTFNPNNDTPYGGDEVKGMIRRIGRRLRLVGWDLTEFTDLRLISRPAPPEPPLRVGDLVRNENGIEWQMLNERHLRDCLLHYDGHRRKHLTRIEPLVGWPVGVKDPDAPGGWRWYVNHDGDGVYWRTVSTERIGTHTWASLLAAGGIPALAPGGDR